MALAEFILTLGSQENSREASPFLGHIDQGHANTPGCTEHSGMRRLPETEQVGTPGHTAGGNASLHCREGTGA